VTTVEPIRRSHTLIGPWPRQQRPRFSRRAPAQPRGAHPSRCYSLAVVLGFTGFFLLVYFNPLRMLAKLPVDIGSLVVAGTKITMEKPHLSASRRTRAPTSFQRTWPNRT